MPNGVSPSALWGKKISSQVKTTLPRDMPMDITSTSRKVGRWMNTNCSTSRKAKVSSNLSIVRRLPSRLATSSCSFLANGIPTIPTVRKDGKLWIGFKGKNIDDRVKHGFLSVEKPIYHVGFSNEIINLYEEAYRTAIEEAAFSQQSLAGIVNHLIGLMYSLERNIELNKDTKHVDIINKARLRIRESLEENLTIQELAVELGMSYSSFRKLFKEHTGFAPALYQQNLKLQRAKELLSTTEESIKEIAYRLNFESPDYFSSKFKSQTGMKPSDFRTMTR